MKKIMTWAVLMTIAISASAMSYPEARREALFLTDKMAYELGLNDAQYNAAYEINLDYLRSMDSRHDVFGPYWRRRNSDLRYVLDAYQWGLYTAASYFYRPLFWRSGWHLHIYTRYADPHFYYRNRPTVWVSYRGGRNLHVHSYYAGRDFGRPIAPPRRVFKGRPMERRMERRPMKRDFGERYMERRMDRELKKKDFGERNMERRMDRGPKKKDFGERHMERRMKGRHDGW